MDFFVFTNIDRKPISPLITYRVLGNKYFRRRELAGCPLTYRQKVRQAATGIRSLQAAPERARYEDMKMKAEITEDYGDAHKHGMAAKEMGKQ